VRRGINIPGMIDDAVETMTTSMAFLGTAAFNQKLMESLKTFPLNFMMLFSK
jgi:hypothetical protein